MGADRVVLPPPVLDNDLGLLQRKEQFPIQQLISELAVEALVVAVLPRAAGFDKERFYPNMCKPLPHGRGCKLGSVIGPDMIWNAVLDEQIRQTIEYIITGDAPLDQQRQALPAVLVNQRQNLQRTPVVRAFADKIIGPHMIAMSRPQPNTGPLV